MKDIKYLCGCCGWMQEYGESNKRLKVCPECSKIQCKDCDNGTYSFNKFIGA